MLGIDNDDIDSLLHLLLGVLAQGEEFYNEQKEEIKNFFGNDKFCQAEKMLKKTRLYELLSGIQ